MQNSAVKGSEFVKGATDEDEKNLNVPYLYHPKITLNVVRITDLVLFACLFIAFIVILSVKSVDLATD